MAAVYSTGCAQLDLATSVTRAVSVQHLKRLKPIVSLLSHAKQSARPQMAFVAEGDAIIQIMQSIRRNNFKGSSAPGDME